MAKKRDIEGNRLYHFELSDKNRTVRWILIGLLLAVGAVALITGLIGALQTPAGWQAVSVTSGKLNCAHAFSFQYDLGAGKESATDERKALTVYYSQLTEKAWELFYNESGETEEKGIYYLNNHPNEAVEVGEGLYEALRVFKNMDSRAIFLAPIYSVYNRVIYSDNFVEAEGHDPAQNEDTAQYVAQLVAFAGDPQAVSLELLSGNKVKLTVSESYLQFAKENELLFFVDFGWLKNAAAADYIADNLVDAGYTNGYLTSVDGYVRNLDSRGTNYDLNVFRKGASGGQLTALVDYQGPVAMVMLRSFPMYQEDADRYYCFENGRIVTTMIDPADGMSKAATDSLIAYGKDKGCLELAIKLMPIYVAETLSEDSLNALTKDGIYSLWIAHKEIRYNQPGFAVESKDPDYKAVAVTY